MLDSDMSGSADNTCRACCSALMLLPSLLSVDIADWVSSPCCRLQQSSLLGEARPGQTRLILSHGAVGTGRLGLSQSRRSQCILHEVLNECKNTQIHKAENECDLNARPPCCGQACATTLEEDVCSAPASLNPTAQSPSTGPQS